MRILISPHDDDSTLFAAFTCIREKPIVIVITDSFIQPNRGDFGCTAEIRAKETKASSEILGCPVIRLGIRDDALTEEAIRARLSGISGVTRVYAPAIQGGNWQHDLIGKVTQEVFEDVIQYTTYTKTELWTKGSTEIIPTQEELEIKEKALWCYQSQINLAATRPHFEAVIGKSEFYV